MCTTCQLLLFRDQRPWSRKRLNSLLVGYYAAFGTSTEVWMCGVWCTAALRITHIYTVTYIVIIYKHIFCVCGKCSSIEVWIILHLSRIQKGRNDLWSFKVLSFQYSICVTSIREWFLSATDRITTHSIPSWCFLPTWNVFPMFRVPLSLNTVPKLMPWAGRYA